MTILFSKNPTTSEANASTTKLLVALLAYSLIPKMDDTATVIPADVVGPGDSRIDLIAGDVVTYLDLLHALLIPSANDAANCLASSLLGRSAFIAAMNSKASALGMDGSYFSDVAGAVSGTTSTASDLVKLMREFSKNEFLVGISATLTYPVKITGPNARTVNVTHTTKFQSDRFPELICAKTGTIQPDRAGDKPPAANIVALWSLPDGKKRISVVLGSGLGSTDRYDDLRTIMDFEILRSKSNATGGVNYNANQISQ